jgi:hypothetical protein
MQDSVSAICERHKFSPMTWVEDNGGRHKCQDCKVICQPGNSIQRFHLQGKFTHILCSLLFHQDFELRECLEKKLRIIIALFLGNTYFDY